MSAERDTNGRFLRGHPGMGGRPRRATEADYLAALSEVVPMEKWCEIVETAADQAIAGDAKAREWVGSYLAGKPTGNALRRLAAAEVEAAAADPIEGPPAVGDALDPAPGRGSPTDARTAHGSGRPGPRPVREGRRPPGRSVARDLAPLVAADDPKFLAACGVAWNERDARPRKGLDALGDKAVAILREALDGHAEPGELRAAVVKLLKINEPASYHASTPAEADAAKSYAARTPR